jgi:hypothetical protein
MRKSVWIAGALGLTLAVGPAYADDKSECMKGVAKLKAMKKLTAKQKKQLADAEQEVLEADWPHCLEILRGK